MGNEVLSNVIMSDKWYSYVEFSIKWWQSEKASVDVYIYPAGDFSVKDAVPLFGYITHGIKGDNSFVFSVADIFMPNCIVGIKSHDEVKVAKITGSIKVAYFDVAGKEHLGWKIRTHKFWSED